MTKPMTGLSVRMTRAIKAELARRDLDGADLIEPLERSRNWIYSRLRYEQPFDLDEVEKIAAFLQMPVDQLIESSKTSPTVVEQAQAVAS